MSQREQIPEATHVRQCVSVPINVISNLNVKRINCYVKQAEHTVAAEVVAAAEAYVPLAQLGDKAATTHAPAEVRT